MKTRVLSAVAGCVFAATAAGAAVVTPGQIARPEGPRYYFMATPEHIAPGKHPLVILLHGHMGSGDQLLVRKRSGFHSALSVWLEISDREQLILIAPNGVKGGDDQTGWNDCRADASTNPKTDDAGFLNALIDKAIADNDADPARVYVMGMSNGGMMTLRMAIESGARLAAVASMGASMPANSLCPAPRAPLSALIISGTSDPIVPYAGGEVKLSVLLRGRGSVIGVEESAAAWRQLDGLATAGSTSSLAHRDASGDTRAIRTLWGQDPHKLQVELIRVENGGHTEPSITQRHPWVFRMMLGAQNADFEVAEEAWAFFKDKKAGLLP